MQNVDSSEKKWNIINYKNFKQLLKAFIKMHKKIIKLGDTTIEKHKFHQPKSPITVTIYILVK